VLPAPVGGVPPSAVAAFLAPHTKHQHPQQLKMRELADLSTAAVNWLRLLILQEAQEAAVHAVWPCDGFRW